MKEGSTFDIKNLEPGNDIGREYFAMKKMKYPFHVLDHDKCQKPAYSHGDSTQFDSGTIYSFGRQVKYGIEPGWGVIVYNDCTSYVGRYAHSRIGPTEYIKHGSGLLRNSGGEIVYKGEWERDKRCGYGIERHKGKILYVGEWKENMRDGWGICYYEDGSRYEGEWKENMRDGQGTYYYKDGAKYVVGWKNDFRDGRGMYFNSKGGFEHGEEWKKGARKPVEVETAVSHANSSSLVVTHKIERLSHPIGTNNNIQLSSTGRKLASTAESSGCRCAIS